MLEFFNRKQELEFLTNALKNGGLGYITGRRRVGKTALLREFCTKQQGLYHQSLEGSPKQQIDHLVLEWKSQFQIFHDVAPKSWIEFFKLLSREKLPKLMILDEFPYLVKSDPTLASILQKFIDHDFAKSKTLFLVSGSAQHMLHSQFLQDSSPLFGRAKYHLHLDPMSYTWFCKATKQPISEESFEKFSLVGGIPHYWQIFPKGSLLQAANTLYFNSWAPLAEEPKRILMDEGVTGIYPKALLDYIGQGVNRNNELANRLDIPQTQISRPMSLLLDLDFVKRELPFGESLRSTKKTLYTLKDPHLLFYYGTYLQHRHRWQNLTTKEKSNLIKQHTGKVWELFCRNHYPGSSRYWEKDLEIDLVHFEPKTGEHLIAECKWKKLSKNKEKEILNSLKFKFEKSKLSSKIKNPIFKVLSINDLKTIAKKEEG